MYTLIYYTILYISCAARTAHVRQMVNGVGGLSEGVNRSFGEGKNRRHKPTSAYAPETRAYYYHS